MNFIIIICILLSLRLSISSKESNKNIYDTSHLVDLNVDCQHWAEIGECKRNKKYMIGYCAKSCSVVESLDIEDNLDAKCEEYASLGECINNPTYMNTHCAKYCQEETKTCKTSQFNSKSIYELFAINNIGQNISMKNFQNINTFIINVPSYIEKSKSIVASNSKIWKVIENIKKLQVYRGEFFEIIYIPMNIFDVSYDIDNIMSWDEFSLKNQIFGISLAENDNNRLLRLLMSSTVESRLLG